MAALLGLVSAFTIGLTDLYGRRLVAATSPLWASATIQFFALIATILLAAFVPGPIEVRPMLFGLASGSGMALGLGAYYTGTQRSSATIVAPIVAILTSLIPFSYELIGGRQLTTLALLGAGFAGLGLVLITSGEINLVGLRAGLGWGLLSGAGYGGATVMFINAASGDTLWPSAGQRLGSFLCLVAFGLATARRRFTLPTSQVKNALGAGALTGVTSASLLAGLAIDPVVATIALSSFPAFAVVVGRIAFGDSITPRQAIGIAVSVVGIALVSTAS